jgi:hypothetical protein
MESITPDSRSQSPSVETVHGRQRIISPTQSSPNGHTGANGINSQAAQVKPIIRRSNLPAQLPSLIGRDEAVLTVCDRLLAAHPGLLTLTGPGGCGKTRLAVAVAESLLDNFEDGVWLVDLAPLAHGALVPSAVLSAVGLRVSNGQSAQARLIEALAGRSLLLVLDNCEHLVESCATLADELLRVGPSLRILATSREPLRVAGERLWRVAGLPFLDPNRSLHYEQMMASPAAKLFVDRAQAVRPEFALTMENFQAIGTICSRLGGLPLAIELAAARTELLSPAQILKRLDDAFAVLAGRRRTGPARHQTIRASIAWSYQLLDADERLLSPDWLCSPVGGHWKQPRRSVADMGFRPQRCSMHWRTWSANRWSRQTSRGPRFVTGSMKLFDSTRANNSTLSARKCASSDSTPSTSFGSLRPLNRTSEWVTKPRGWSSSIVSAKTSAPLSIGLPGTPTVTSACGWHVRSGGTGISAET